MDLESSQYENKTRLVRAKKHQSHYEMGYKVKVMWNKKKNSSLVFEKNEM